MSFINKLISKNLKIPKKGPIGYYLAKFFIKNNGFFVKTAAKLCNIQPDDHVLEIGFGPGSGLVEAHKYIKDGSGKVYGLDYSKYMVEMASKLCRQMILDGKVDIQFGSVTNMPYNDNKFESVFHLNCYYFWPDMMEAAREIYRVMKPGSVMITCINSQKLNDFHNKGWMQEGNTDAQRYISALKDVGFESVVMEQKQYKQLKYQVITAKLVQKKSA